MNIQLLSFSDTTIQSSQVLPFWQLKILKFIPFSDTTKQLFQKVLPFGQLKKSWFLPFSNTTIQLSQNNLLISQPKKIDFYNFLLQLSPEALQLVNWMFTKGLDKWLNSLNLRKYSVTVRFCRHRFC